MAQSGGSPGVRDLAALESALAQETFLLLNGYELDASIDDAERIIIGVAAATCSREDLLRWIREHSIVST
jgi:prophage maintenance system killer protein